MWRNVAVVVALALTACSPTGEIDREATTDADGTTTSVDARGSSPSSPTSPSSSVEANLLAALDGFVASTIRVNDPPDVNHPDLGRFRTGAVLENAVASVHLNQLVGIGFRLPAGSVYSHTPTIQTLSDTSAVVHDCVVDDAQQVNIVDGTVFNSSVATKLFATTLLLVDGMWKVAENSLLHRWEGVATCEQSGS
jgi:hypothetical protein